MHSRSCSRRIPCLCNNTRVINARIRFRKETGSEVEVFPLEPLDPEDYVLMFQSRGRCGWSCMVGNLKRWKSGALTKELYVDGRKVTLTALRGEARPGNAHVVEFSWDALDLTFASYSGCGGIYPDPSLSETPVRNSRMLMTIRRSMPG